MGDLDVVLKGIDSISDGGPSPSHAFGAGPNPLPDKSGRGKGLHY